MAMISQLITERTHAPPMLNMCQDTPFLGKDGFKSMMALGWIWFHRLLINRSFSTNLENWEEEMKWAFMAIHSLWDCESFQLPMCRIYGRLPTAESSFLYSFAFVFGPSHSRSQAERFLWNRLACSDTKKICVCLLLILFYVSTQCFHACWHVHLIHIFHAHSAWLKISSKPRVKRSAVAPAWHRCLLRFPGLPQRG